jgi:uncharacterized protein YegP (UPF0339 family)
MKKSTKILFPIKSKLNSLGSSWVEVTKRSNGWYVQLKYNNGNSSDKIEIYSTKSGAIRKAEALRKSY